MDWLDAYRLLEDGLAALRPQPELELQVALREAKERLSWSDFVSAHEAQTEAAIAVFAQDLRWPAGLSPEVELCLAWRVQSAMHGAHWISLADTKLGIEKREDEADTICWLLTYGWEQSGVAEIHARLQARAEGYFSGIARGSPDSR